MPVLCNAIIFLQEHIEVNMVFLNLEVISCQPHKYQCLGLIILAPIMKHAVIYLINFFALRVSCMAKMQTLASFHYFVNKNNSRDNIDEP